MRPRLSAGNLLSEAGAGLVERPARAVLTVLGTVLGIASLVATLGVSKTAGSQIVGRFDELAATEVVVEPASDRLGAATSASTLPWDAEARLARLNGVVAAGSLSDVDVGGAPVRSVPVTDTLAQTDLHPPIKAASPGLFAAVRARLATGRVLDAGYSTRHDRVAVLGPGAARRLHIDRVDQQPAIFIGDRLFVVVGILADTDRQPDLLDAVIIPEGTATDLYGLAAPALVEVDTAIGAAGLIARQAPVVLDPDDPSRLRASWAGEPQQVRRQVESDVGSLFLVLGGVLLLVGAIGIANVTLVSVLERVGEIGLRRALGAARRHVAAQFLVESTAMGVGGGIVGSTVGVLVVVAVAAAHGWTPVLDAWVPLMAPLLGAAVGLVAGAYPSLRAARLEPVDALRAGM